MNLQVLMMGGQRVGKSSALAAVMDAFISGHAKDVLTAKDTTVLTKIEGEKQASISSKLAEAQEMLSKYKGKTIIVNSGKTNKKWDYNLALTIAGTNDTMTMTFTDVNGEFFEGGNIHQDEIISLIQEYDVFIVAIDTPFMMEARNDENEFVDSIINRKYNCIDGIHTFLSQIDDQNGQNSKLVIFTPIKCELWAKSGRLSDVVEAVNEDYHTTISALKKYKSIQIEILPIQTVGSATFDSHREAYVFEWVEKMLFLFKRNMSSKCGLLPDGRIILSNGEVKGKGNGTLKEDMDAVLIAGSDIVRPNSWFKIESNAYAPHNCEQLAFHILEFMLLKVLDAKIREEEGQCGFIKGVKAAMNFILNVGTLGLWNKLKDLFGDISIDQMQKAIAELKSKNMIKYSGEGISIIKSCTFKQ